MGGCYHNFISFSIIFFFSAAEEKYPRSDTPDILDELSTDNQQSSNVVLEETAGMSSMGEQQEAARVEGNF